MLDWLEDILGYKDRIATLEENLRREREHVHYLNQQIRAENGARAVIETMPEYDHSDPDNAGFNALLEGEKWLEELSAKKGINWFIKFVDLLKAIGDEYYRAYEAPIDDWGNFDLEFDELHSGGFRFRLYEEDDMGGRWERGKLFVPIDFIWTDWKSRCETQYKKRETAHQAELSQQVLKRKQYREKREKEQYQRAKQLIEKFEGNSDESTE